MIRFDPYIKSESNINLLKRIVCCHERDFDTIRIIR